MKFVYIQTGLNSAAVVMRFDVFMFMYVYYNNILSVNQD